MYYTHLYGKIRKLIIVSYMDFGVTLYSYNIRICDYFVVIFINISMIKAIILRYDIILLDGNKLWYGNMISLLECQMFGFKWLRDLLLIGPTIILYVKWTISL